MRGFDFSTWSSVLTTLLGLALFALVGVGIRLIFMMTLQQRRERLNRQINERLKLLIAAYKVLGGSFTGTLIVDPRHRRDFHIPEAESPVEVPAHFDRARQIRDSVEASLSDIILLGTEDQVRLAATAAADLAAGRPVETVALVASLRDFIRKALDLDPIPPDVTLPAQGPTRPGGAGGRSRSEAGGRSGGGGGGGGGAGIGLGLGLGTRRDDPPTG
jgi:uncharacterized membrane protein YgcG